MHVPGTRYQGEVVGVQGCTGPGGYTGWVYRVGVPGSTTQPPCAREEQAQPAKRAPDGPAGAGSGWVGCSGRVTGGGTAPRTTLRARSGTRTLPVLGPSECRLLAITARFHSYSRNLVKTAKCHQNVTKRPVIVPISQNGSRKSPLDFLGFTFWLAFSHKELMGHFEPTARVYVKK